jgi:CrcB protein
MVLVTQVWPRQRLIRPFIGVGVLGGFTTFSTYVVDIQRLTDHGAPGIALVYLAGTVLAALLAVFAGMTVTERLLGARS